MGRFHLEEKLGASSTCNMKSRVTIPIAALDTGTHFLLANIATLENVTLKLKNNMKQNWYNYLLKYVQVSSAVLVLFLRPSLVP